MRFWQDYLHQFGSNVDMQKRLFCHDSRHKITPTLSALAAALMLAEQEIFIQDDKHPNGATMNNYAGKLHRAGIYIRTAMAEVDKLIIMDNNSITRGTDVEG